jgi:hypothetical protein
VVIATKSQGKTSFVRKFLQNNPDGNTQAVNEAWRAAGMKGTISHPVISEARKVLGLIGNRPGKTKNNARAKSATKTSRTASSPGKMMFVKEFLNDHPQSQVDAVNEAWQAAGFKGTISRTVVDKMRASLGLTGNLRGSIQKSEKSVAVGKRIASREETTALASVQPRANRRTVLDDIEADIDRLLFKVMGIGDLIEIEDTLRRARRLLYGALS